MDISERRKPQDGRGRIKLERQEADTRVSSMPTMHGETVVIRLLRKETEKAKTLAEVAWTSATGWWSSGPSASPRG